MRCGRVVAWRINGTGMDDGDIMCHPVLVLPFRQDFDNARVGAERNPPKTEAIHHVNDLDAAPLEWKICDVRSLAKTLRSYRSITLGVAVGPQFITDQLLSKADVIRALPGSADGIRPLRESLSVSRINHILRVHGHTILEEQRAAAVYDEIGQRLLERLFPGLTEDSMTQATLSAGQSGIGFKRAPDIAAPAHLGSLIAAEPRIQATIRDADRAGLLPEVIETALLHLSQRTRQRRACNGKVV